MKTVSKPLSQTITYAKQKPKLEAPFKRPIDEDPPQPKTSNIDPSVEAKDSISLFQGETQTDTNESVCQ